MRKILSTRYDGLIAHYYFKNPGLGVTQLSDLIQEFEAPMVSKETFDRMVKRWMLSQKEDLTPEQVELETWKAQSGNTLVIGDLHAPFILEGYLDFCQNLSEKYNCDQVIFIGDVIDGAGWNFHERDPDGMGVGHELDAAIAQLTPWYEAFPTAKIMLGNHDLLIARKAKAIGMSQRFVKPLGEILQAPTTWEFMEEYQENGVLYTHGNVGNAFKRAKDSRLSTVQGHLHSEASVNWSVSVKDRLFGMQVGCGIDHEAYAFSYGKPFPRKPVISAGLVLENGSLPFVELMEL
ncbi:metallophosphoesterase [Hymenobacter sp. M29]|uniref:Metallophosphoesterase n=1 Tax=Hymenobacter mellowenesis TaxID=3063995 RepID=A0ABT9ADM8_9BACT|nr:metallophosphoesterase [Hymenobacter sp. M29]MDO7847653.1 metallophosphoesterase [Hymenobacter sp. M29]